MAQPWTQQQLINSPCRTCFLRWQSSHSGTDTTHSSSANVLVSWYLVVTVTTSFGRDRRQRIRQDRCDDPKRPFMNVPSNSVNPSSSQLNYDLCTPAVNLMFSLAVYATRQQSRTPPARSDQFCFERITFFVAAQARICLCQSTLDRAQPFTVAQVPRTATFCVGSQRVQSVHQLIHRLSECTVLINHIYTLQHPERLLLEKNKNL